MRYVIVFSILMGLGVCYADGPLYKSKDVIAQQEFDNVYQDLRNIRVSTVTVQAGSTNYIQNQNTLQTSATFNIQSGNIVGQLGVGGVIVSSGTTDGFSHSYSELDPLTNDRTGIRLTNTTTGYTLIETSVNGTRRSRFYTGANPNGGGSINLEVRDADNTTWDTVFIATNTGAMTQPKQPNFLVTNSAGATDVTGDGTVYTVLWGNEIYDQAGNFSSNTFTAPVTGRYLLTATVTLENLLVTHTTKNMFINTSNRTYVNLVITALAATDYTFHVSAIADMDANDTAVISTTATGGTKTVDILSNASYNTFSGSLIN